MKAKNISEVKKGYFWGGFSGLSWGLNTVVIGYILSCEPFLSSTLLLASAALVCCFFHDGFAALWITIFITAKNKTAHLIRNIKSKDALFCILGAVLGGPIGMSFYILAIKNAGPAYTATITCSYPAIGAALAVLFLKERLSLKSWFGISLAIFGVIWLGYEPSETALSGEVYLGIVFAIISAFGWALESVICAYGMKSGKIDPEMALCIREISSFLCYALLVIPLLAGGYTNVLEVLNSKSIYLLLFVALIGVSSYLAWYKSIDTIGASRAISLNVSYSFWAVIFSFLLFGGEFSWKMIVCSCLIVLGVSFAVGKPKDALNLI